MINIDFMAWAIICSFIIGGAGFLLAVVSLAQVADLRRQMRRIKLVEEYGRHSG